MSYRTNPRLTLFIEQEIQHRIPRLEIRRTKDYTLPSFMYGGRLFVPPEVRLVTSGTFDQPVQPEEQIIEKLLYLFQGTEIDENRILFHRGFNKHRDRIYGTVATASYRVSTK